MTKPNRRQIARLAAALLMIGSGCQFAARLPSVFLGMEQRQQAAEVAVLTQQAARTPPAPQAETLPPSPHGGAAPTSAATSTATRTAAQPPAQEPPATAGAIVLGEVSTEETSEDPNFVIRARYPSLEWGGDPREKAFNAAAEQIALDEIRGFKGYIFGIDQSAPGSDTGSFMQMDFAPLSVDKGIVSVLFTIDYYSAGAAHPGRYHIPLNYHLETGKVLELGDLFETGAAYLDALSTFCLDDLRRQDRLGWEDGALPTPENYRVWNITEDGLMITFDEYQVNAYAAGAQRVLVPYNLLQPIARTDGPLKGYLGD